MRLQNTQLILKDKLEQFPIDEILNKDQRIVKGWLSVEVKDRDGELVPVAELKKTLNTWMMRGGFITDQHTNRVIGKSLRWYEDKHKKSGKQGVVIEYQIFKDYTVDDEVWKEIKDGTRKGLSFGGRATGQATMEKDEDSGGMARKLAGIEAYEVASVTEPANQLADNIAVNFMAKAFDKRNSEEIKLMTDLQKGYAAEDIMKPFAGFADFTACVTAQKDRGHTEDSADRICGWLKNKIEDTNEGDSTMKQIEKGKIYLKPGQQPPPGAQVQTGEDGKQFYEMEGAVQPSVPQIPKIPQVPNIQPQQQPVSPSPIPPAKPLQPSNQGQAPTQPQPPSQVPPSQVGAGQHGNGQIQSPPAQQAPLQSDPKTIPQEDTLDVDGSGQSDQDLSSQISEIYNLDPDTANRIINDVKQALQGEQDPNQGVKDVLRNEKETAERSKSLMQKMDKVVKKLSLIRLNKSLNKLNKTFTKIRKTKKIK